MVRSQPLMVSAAVLVGVAAAIHVSPWQQQMLPGVPTESKNCHAENARLRNENTELRRALKTCLQPGMVPLSASFPMVCAHTQACAGVRVGSRAERTRRKQMSRGSGISRRWNVAARDGFPGTQTTPRGGLSQVAQLRQRIGVATLRRRGSSTTTTSPSPAHGAVPSPPPPPPQHPCTHESTRARSGRP